MRNRPMRVVFNRAGASMSRVNAIREHVNRHGQSTWEVSFAAASIPGCILSHEIEDGQCILDITRCEDMKVRVDLAHLAVDGWKDMAPRTVNAGLSLLAKLMDIPEMEREYTSAKLYNVGNEYLGESMDPMALAHALILGKGSAPLILEEGAEPEDHDLSEVDYVMVERHGAPTPATPTMSRMASLGLGLVEDLVSHLDLRHMSAMLYAGDDLLGESFNPMLAADWLLCDMRVVDLFVVDEDGEGAAQNVNITGVTRVVLRSR